MVRIIVLFSGGIDSAVVLREMMADEDECFALAFDYAQPHRIELEYAQGLAHEWRVPFGVLVLPNLPAVKDRGFAGRNLLFAATAVAHAHGHGFDAIAVGGNSDDWSRHPDSRLSFWDAVTICAAAYGVCVIAPLLHVSKAGVVARARKAGVPIKRTWSCETPKGRTACGTCFACKARDAAMAED